MSNFTPWWHPKSIERKLENLYVRNAVKSGLQVFFANNDFMEVETPALQVCPGMEPHLRAFETQLDNPLAVSKQRYLHTSPEFAMKKLLVGGLPRIFQFAQVFRNNESSTTHHPEFTMLEWYRSGQTYEALMKDCEELLQIAAEFSSDGLLHFEDRVCDPNKECRRITVAEAFQQYTSVDILLSLKDPSSPSVEVFAKQATDIGININDNDSWDDIFFRIFLERIERNLGINAPTILYEYPSHMAALSRVKPGNPQVAERFELYVCGLELANAFSELTDPQIQRKRFEADMELKSKLYGVTYPIDEDFISALELGLPESAGIALGFDRLVMLVANAANIEDVLWAPVR